jgi:tetratricopeptide (TPR) repeat protein
VPKQQQNTQAAAPPVPVSVLILWIFGGVAYALIVYVFTPFTHNLDDLKVALQYSLAPMVWAFFGVALWSGHIQRVHPTIVLSLFAFMLVMLLATLVSAFPWRAWHDFAYQMTVMAPFLVVVGTATNERRFRNMCLFYFLIACGTIVFGLFHYFGGIGYLFRAFFPRGVPEDGHYGPLFTLLYTLRTNGDMLSTILNRDFYSAYLIMVLPLGVAMAIDYPDVRAKVFFLGTFFFGCVCIIVAFSKDSIAALFISLVVFLVLYAARHNWRSVPRVVWWLWIIGGVLVIATAMFAVRDRLHGLGGNVNTSVMSRKVIWGGSWKVFCDTSRPPGEFLKYLVIGGGPGAFYLKFPLYRDPYYHLYQISHITIFSHCQYLDLTAEEGLLGFVTFMFFLGAVTYFLAREAWRKFRHPLNVYQIMLLASIIGVSFQNIFTVAIRWTVCGFAYYFLLGLCVAARRVTVSDSERRWIENFYEFSPALRKFAAGGFLVVALLFEAISVPYGLTYFNAAKTNNDGLVELQEFSNNCDAMSTSPSLQQNAGFISAARQSGMRTIEELSRALAWQRDFITSYYKLAHVYSRMATSLSSGQESETWWRKAQATYDTLSTYAPDYSEIHINYGILGRIFNATTGKPEPLAVALTEYQRSAKMSNRLSVQNAYSEVLQRAAQDASTSSPLQAETVSLFAQVLYKMNPPGTGDEWMDSRLGELAKLVQQNQIQIAGDLEAEMFAEMAIRVAKRIPTLINYEATEGDEYVRRAQVLVANYCTAKGRYDEAIPALRALVEDEPENPYWLSKWKLATNQAGKPRVCLELLAKMIQLNPMNWAAHNAAREVLEQVGDYRKALEQGEGLLMILQHLKKSMPELFDPQKGAGYRQQFGGLPSLAEGYYRVAFLAEKLNLLEESFNDYKKSIDEDPNSDWGKRSKEQLSRLLTKIQQMPSSPPPPTSGSVPIVSPKIQPKIAPPKPATP